MHRSGHADQDPGHPIPLWHLEGHDYCLMMDNEDRIVRHDEQDGENHSEDMPYSIKDAVMFYREMNGELLQENESMCVPDIDYLTRLHQDEQALDALMARTATMSCQDMETVSCPKSRAYPAA